MFCATGADRRPDGTTAPLRGPSTLGRATSRRSAARYRKQKAQDRAKGAVLSALSLALRGIALQDSTLGGSTSSFWAAITAWVRECTPSLRRMAVT